MRVAFTIVLNGLHHLKHQSFAERMINVFDYWVIVEGASGNAGSTQWCRGPLPQYNDNGRSVDGTAQFLWSLRKRADNVHLIERNSGVWESKDAMVNAATDYIGKNLYEEPIFLWEVDVDEQWLFEDVKAAERDLVDAEAKTGMFHANFFVGKNLVVRGEWGEGKLLPYNRLWFWQGEGFEKHEPPILQGGNDPAILLPQRFNHYSYYFEQDVKFKDQWYGGHNGIYENWLKLQKLRKEDFPVSISSLLTFQWGDGTGLIHHL